MSRRKRRAITVNTTLAQRADALRRAAQYADARGIPIREMRLGFDRASSGICHIARIDGEGIVRVYHVNDAAWPLVQSMPGRPVEPDATARLRTYP